MDFVVDANVLISVLIAPAGKTCELFFSDKLRLYAPEYLFEELKKHEEEILDKSKLSRVDLEVALTLLSSRIEFIPFSEFKALIPKANKICPDPNDVEYFALVLTLKCVIWSNDKKIKGQNFVNVLSTSELLNTFL